MARDAIEQIGMTRRMLEEYQDTFQLVLESGDVRRIYDSGKIACSIGVEGSVLFIFGKLVITNKVSNL